MTQAYKRAIYTLAIWGFVLLAFVLLFFFAGGGPGTFVGDKVRFVVVAVIFLGGYISYFTMLYLTRSNPDDVPRLVDERDESIASQASGVAFLAVLGYVYLICIILHLTYEESGCMPVGWMWFLGYSSIFMGYIMHAATALAIDRRMRAHGEG